MSSLQSASTAEPRTQVVHDLEGVPLDQLFEEAMRYGEISLFQSSRGFSFNIEFQAVAGCKFAAHSGFGHGRIEAAIIAAIDAARKIKGQFRP